jgi:hypothetical protein
MLEACPGRLLIGANPYRWSKVEVISALICLSTQRHKIVVICNNREAPGWRYASQVVGRRQRMANQ